MDLSTFNGLKHVLILLATATTLIGTPIFALMLHRLRRVHMSAIKTFMFPEAESLFKSARESHAQITEALKTQMKTLTEGGRERILGEIHSRIGYLEASRAALKDLRELRTKQMGRIADNYSAVEGDTLNLIYAQESIEIFERVDNLVAELMSLEEKALKDLTPQNVSNG